MRTEFRFAFGGYHSRILIQDEFPAFHDILQAFPGEGTPVLLVCDSNTESLTRKIAGSRNIPVLVLKSGEKAKTWESVDAILHAGRDAGLGRDGFFIGLGGGVIGDLTAFAASIYMRGVRLCLISTTLLGMVDASLGGKTGIDLLGLKNLAGTFYPAGLVVISLEALDTLPEKEWKSGMAELIKTAVLDSDKFLDLIKKLSRLEGKGRSNPDYRECLGECICWAVAYKGRIVEADPQETGMERPLLNLGHTFGHALEAAAGLGILTHGEAVAWGMARACELGAALGITPLARAREITESLKFFGFETAAPHMAVNSIDILLNFMKHDKKSKAGKYNFIIPGEKSARLIPSDTPALLNSGGEILLRKILEGECPV
jgi:3-dehydroquinate synthase